MTIEFPKLTPWQQDLHDAMKNSYASGKIYTVKAKRQVGKSIIAAIETIIMALEHKSISVILEPTMPQCRRVYKDIKSWTENAGIVSEFNNSLYEIKFNNGSEIVFKSAEQRDRLRGLTVSGLLVIDEAAFIPDDIIDIVFPWTDAHRAPVLLISTPLFEDGRYYNLYTSADNKTSFSFDWAQYDTSVFLPAEKLDYYKSIMSPLKFQSEYLGLFIEDASFVFKNITGCIQKEPTNSQPVYCGIDWGTGSGADYTAVTMMDENGNFTDIIYFNNLSPDEQIKEVTNIINSKISLKSVRAELNSIGKVYFDTIKNRLSRPRIFNGFTTTNDTKREIIESLSVAIQNNTVTYPDDKELISQLQHYACEKTPAGKLTYNALPGHHDDIVISMALCLSQRGSNKAKYTLKIS